MNSFTQMSCTKYPKIFLFFISFLIFVILLIERIRLHFQYFVVCTSSHEAVNTSNSNKPTLLIDKLFSLVCDKNFQQTKTNITNEDEEHSFRKIKLRSLDDSIRLTVIPFGATLTELWVKDRFELWRDIILGYDDAKKYSTDSNHPYFGAIVGRYANRITNGTFTIDGKKFQTNVNEFGKNTLHGGKFGYDRRIFDIEEQNSTSVVLSIYDFDGNQGFPASVYVKIRYTLENESKLKMTMDANVTDELKTPIMLSSHIHWSLHGFVGEEDNKIFNHSLHLPKANKYIVTDEELLPTGEISTVKDTPLDFQQPKRLLELYNEPQGLCGKGCKGWDTCLVMEKHERDETILTLKSPETGIKMNIKSNQDAIQLYTCNSISNQSGNKISRKSAHGGKLKFYENYSCLVIELEDYIDAINHPNWNRNQIYSIQKPFHWETEYSFSKSIN